VRHSDYGDERDVDDTVRIFCGNDVWSKTTFGGRCFFRVVVDILEFAFSPFWRAWWKSAYKATLTCVTTDSSVANDDHVIIFVHGALSKLSIIEDVIFIRAMLFKKGLLNCVCEPIKRFLFHRDF
jgi:hypothetical protein